MIALALGMGAAVLAGTMVFVRGDGVESTLDAGLVTTIWAAVYAASFVPAVLFYRRAAALHESGDARQRARMGENVAAKVLAWLVVSWAIVEAPALLGAAVFLLTGATLPLLAGVPLFLAWLAFTFPRAHWFEGLTPASAP